MRITTLALIVVSIDILIIKACLNPTWASSNNSVFLCSKCALLHKSLGDNISNVKSLEVSDWTDKEITILKIGGNKRLASLMEEYRIPNRIIKYNTRIAHFYRKLIDLEALMINGNDLDEEYKLLLLSKPYIDNGIELIETFQIEDNVNECVPPAHTVHEGVKEDLEGLSKAVGGIFGWLGGAFHTTVQKIGIDKKLMKTKEEINEHLSKIEVNPNIKQAGNKVYEAMKYSTIFVSNKVKETEAYKTMTFGVDQGYLTLKNKFQDIVRPFKFNENEKNCNKEDININELSNIDNDNNINASDDNNDIAPPLNHENDSPGFIDINKSDF